MRRNRAFAILAVVGLVLRVGVTFAYRPALIYYDSAQYLRDARTLAPDVVRPLGYAAFLRVVVGGLGLAAVPVIQHAMGLLIAGLLYVLLQRCGAPRWISALGTAPVLLDGFQLSIEQFVLSETLFELLLVGACVALLWRFRPAIAPAVVAGVLIALAALTRSIGVMLLAPALLALVMRELRRPWPALALLMAFLIPIGGYAIWYHAVHGRYATTGAEGRFLYARVAPIADCSRLSLPRRERVLCPREPLEQRGPAGHYMWSRASPLYAMSQTQQNTVGRRFAEQVIRQQPLAYLTLVAADTARAFAPTGTLRGNNGPARWRFALEYPTYGTQTRDTLLRNGYERGEVNKRLARLLAGYQRRLYVSGPLLAGCLLAALLAIVGAGRARRSGLRTATFLFAGCGMAVLLGAIAINDFTWRYRMPLIVCMPAAAALAATALALPAARDHGNRPAIGHDPGAGPAPQASEPLGEAAS